MKLLSVTELALPEIKVIEFARFRDERGYFTEHYRKSDFQSNKLTDCMRDVEFVQMNTSFSRAGTIRGLHFQWNPYMGKLVRTIQGRMIDLVLDIRPDSETLGKIIAFDMPADAESENDRWIWVPPGFAHGNYFPQDTTIEYLCSGEYSPGCEAGISPFARDLDWSLAAPDLASMFANAANSQPLITDKDRDSLTIAGWVHDDRSRNFTGITSAATESVGSGSVR
jgi:dTDP-4-dehydrorhamnose 3,5-epimerase